MTGPEKWPVYLVLYVTFESVQTKKTALIPRFFTSLQLLFHHAAASFAQLVTAITHSHGQQQPERPVSVPESNWDPAIYVTKQPV